MTTASKRRVERLEAALDAEIEAELNKLTPDVRERFLREFAAEHELPWGDNAEPETR